MLCSIKDLGGFLLRAVDGEAGRIRDVYIDDRRWTVLYLVVDTCKWLNERSVLILPSAVGSIRWNAREVMSNLTRAQVDLSPEMSTHDPEYRRREAEYSPYAALWTWGAMPVIVPRVARAAANGKASGIRRKAGADAHLRSSRIVRGYHIRATDDSVGHVADFLFDEDTWAIRYVVADTRNWLPGKHVLIPPRRIRDVSWNAREFRVNLTRRQIERSPEYDASHLPD